MFGTYKGLAVICFCSFVFFFRTHAISQYRNSTIFNPLIVLRFDRLGPLASQQQHN